MSVEEAAQEVRRILHLNDVDETLHYLSTVTRSIEANQHDLRAAIGNSYRDLLAACDGVVGVEKDCLDILAIESALEHRGAGAPATAPVLPPEWFAKRQHRRRRTTLTTTPSVGLTDRNMARTAGAGFHVAASRLQAKPADGAAQTTAAAAECVGEPPKVVLPLPSSVLQCRDASSRDNTSASDRKNTEVNAEKATQAVSRMLLEERLRLDDELQSLHVQYMAAATAAKAKDGVVRDMEAMLAIVGEDGADAADPAKSFLCLPLLSLAWRLRSVQDTLAVCKANCTGWADLDSTAVPVVVVQKPSSPLLQNNSNGNSNESKRSTRVPAWLNSFQRRATTLETRLVKLLLLRLRRAADGYAQLADQQLRMEQFMKHSPLFSSASAAAPPSSREQNSRGVQLAASQAPRPTAASASASVLDATRAKEAAETSRRALAMTANHYAVYVYVVLAECHGVLRALGTSPTLLGAFAACAPGVDLVRVHLPTAWVADAATVTAAATTANAEALLMGTAALEKSADPLFYLASLKTRDVVGRILFSSDCTSLQQQQSQRDATSDAFRGADPTRWLLALLSLLLLREAQVSAARWSVVSADNTGATAAATTPTMDQHGSSTSQHRGQTDRSFQTGSTMPHATRSRAFANSAFLSSLGLPFAASADASVAVTNARNTAHTAPSDTAWALRCFSGLSFVLRSFADYLDLVKASALLHQKTQSALLREEVDVVRLLHEAFKGSEELQAISGGGTITNAKMNSNSSNGVEMTSTQVGVQRGGARTLEELLTWRLRRCNGGVEGLTTMTSAHAEGFGTPHEVRPPLSANTTLSSVYDSATPSGQASLLSAEPNTTAAGVEGTPKKQLTSFGANTDGADAAVSRPALPATARCRAYVETLRASLSTVPELSSTGTTSIPPLPLFTKKLPVDVPPQPLTQMGVALSGGTAVVSQLYCIAHELLAPLLSSLVVGLARDPVAIAEFDDYCTVVQDARNPLAGGVAKTSPASSASAASSTLTAPLQTSLLSRVKERSTMDLAGLGETWKEVNREQWWESTRRTALHAALQRCFTVALHTVGVVEGCVLHGLVSTSRSLTPPMKADEAEAEAEPLKKDAQEPRTGHHRFSNAGAPTEERSATWSSAQLQQTWAVLMTVLQRHTLFVTPPTRSDAGGAWTPAAEGAVAQQTPERRSRNDDAATAAGANRATTTSILTEAVNNCGRGRALVAAGINWSRFRGAGKVSTRNTCSNGGQGSMQLNDSLNSSTRVAMRGAGDGLFREEALEQLRTALRAAQLPALFVDPAAAASPECQSGALDAERQQALVAVLSGFREGLFLQGGSVTSDAADGSAPVSAADVEGGMDENGAGRSVQLNGHAAELLHQCLLTLVSAVRAFGTTASATATADGGSGAVTANGTEAVSGSSFYTRVVAWLRDALARVEAQLPYLNQEVDLPPQQPTPAEVVHSYEIALLLRVYGDVLRQLAALSSQQATHKSVFSVGEAGQLCEKADALYCKASRLWQHVLVQRYTSALRNHYRMQLRLEEDGAGNKKVDGPAVSSRSAQQRSMKRRLAGLATSSSWIRDGANPSSTSAPADSRSRGASNRYGSYGVVYPAVPTPGLTMVVQQTLGLLHQALYGKATVYSSSGGCGGNLLGDGEKWETDGKVEVATGSSAASHTSTALAGVTHQLVSASQRQVMLRQLSQASATLFERELFPLIATSATPTASSASATAGDDASGSFRDADDVRLQWLMDMLFLSSVWSFTSRSNNRRSDDESDDAVPALLQQTASSTAAAMGSPYLVSGPLQHAAALLERSCDAVRWRSALPLVFAAYRQFVSASAALWVVCGEEDDSDTGGLEKKRETTTSAVHNGEKQALVSAALVAAMKPVAPGSVSGVDAASTPVERLLQPRERVDRLALLPIAVSSATTVAAAAAATAGTIGAASTGNMLGVVSGPAFTIAAPTAASLNPYASPSGAVGNGAAAPGAAGVVGGYRSQGQTPMPPHIASMADGACGSVFYDRARGGADVDGAMSSAGGGSTAIFGAAGAGASSAAAAASSLWGTTQRGWNQLWGSR